MFIKRIKGFFGLLSEDVRCGTFYAEQAYSQCRDIKSRLLDVDQWSHERFAELKKQNADIIKLLSSIEMEMMIARGGCKDNNFEGKTDL